MAGYIGSKAVNLSTTGADINGDANIDGDLSFGDNDKAIFGAGSDLQIYHDGAHSYIDDAGTGNLYVRGTNLVLGNASGSNSYLAANDGGSVYLYHAGQNKLETTSTGVEVTGNIANASGDLTLDVAGDINLDADGAVVNFQDGGTTFGLVTQSSSDFVVRNPTLDKDVVFKGNDGGSTITALTLDMSNAGAATFNSSITGSGPIQALAGNQLRAFTADDSAFIAITSNEIDVSSGNLTLDVAGNIILDANNVGIGTSLPSSYYANHLVVDTGSSAQSGITIVSGTGNQGMFAFADGTSGDQRYRGAIDYNHSNDSMAFLAAGSEAMRINASGHLLIGKTADDNTTAGIALHDNGFMSVARSSNVAMILDRHDSDGDILRFTKSGSTVGSIGTLSGNLFIGSTNGSDAYLGFSNTFIFPVTSTGANRDNAISLGVGASRFDDIFATNGTIQTSDRNEKQDIEELTDAEQRVAVAAKGLLRKFRWKDAVAEKGNEARTHFGIIAQDLQAAFAAEGLDAGDYAMFISSTWTDEETGEERTRMGVRYSELLAFIIGAL